MTKLTKSELTTSSKEKLITLGKKLYQLALKPSETKEAMIKRILRATEEKPAAKKAGKANPKPEKKSAPRAVKTSEKKEKPAAVTKPVPTATAAPAPAAAKGGGAKAAETGPAKGPTQRRRKERPALDVTLYQGKPSATAEEDVEKSKYFVASAQEHLEAPAIADRYNDNRIMLFVRDPYWVFGAWDLHPHKPEETARKHNINLSEFNVALRVYDVTDVVFNGQNDHKHFDVDVGTIKGSWYINVPEDDRRYVADVGLRNRRGEFFVMARSNAVGTPRHAASDRKDEEWMIADEDFWRMYALSGGFKAGQGAASMELTEMMRARLAGETSSGAISSFGSERPARARDRFWYRLDCELVVYGATEPDATVTMMGEKVQLRPDGTFTARFALPDGIQVIDTKAVSANKKFEKTITPTVSRGTSVFQNREFEEEIKP
ncbi:MAG: DUF4912 domain-containing protein [Nitrospinae bacterium]|nr:DUF4912 domain-containing protein [Nitrospinota bacterium]